MTRFTPLALTLGVLLASTSAHAANNVQVNQIGEGELILVNQADQGSATATITQSGQRNRVQVDQTDTLHNPPTYRNQAVIVQEGHDNKINNGLLLPAVRPGQNNTVAGGALNQINLKQDGFNNGIGYSQSGQGHKVVLVQGGNDNSARLMQSGSFGQIYATQRGSGNFMTFEQSGNFDLSGGVQEGIDNRMTVSQTGDGEFGNVQQSGQGNTVLALQSGPSAFAQVTQGGTGNFIQIVH